MNIKEKHNNIDCIPKVYTIAQSGAREKTYDEWNAETAQKTFQYLDNRITATRKTVTAWDVLRVTHIPTNINDFLQLYTNLAPNSALIYNLPENTKIGNEYYAVGDIIYSDMYGKIHHFPVQSKGYYYPNYYELNGSTYGLHYTYTDQIPIDTEIPQDITTEPSDPTTDRILRLTEQESKTIFNQKINIERDSTGEIVLDIPDTPMWPVINYFVLGNDDQKEKLYWDEDYTIVGSKVLITNSTSFNIIQVIAR